MAIHRHHADRIYRGDKRFEFRRQRPRFTGGIQVFIYEPTPVQAVTGHFHVAELVDIDNNLSELETDNHERQHVKRYLHGARRPTAIGVDNPTRLEQPTPLSAFGITTAPQSYIYLPTA